jgi:hypothetical protein
VMAERGLYDLPPVTKTPVLGVLGVPDVSGVLPVLGDSGQDSDWVGQEGCPSLTIDKHRENIRVGQVGQGGQPFTQGRVHDIDQDIAELFDAVDLTLIDDEPSDDMLLTPHDSTADLSPAAQAADFTNRVQQLADMVRPAPSVSPSRDAPPAINEASAEAMRAQVDGDTRLAAPAKVSRKTAAGHHTNPSMFGHWTVKRTPLSDAPPPRDEASAKATGAHRDHTNDYEEDTV